MPVPSSLITYVPPLFTKLPDLSLTPRCVMHAHGSVICTHHSWMNSHVEDALVSVQVFELYPVDRRYSLKKAGGGVVTLQSSSWTSRSEQIHSNSFSGTDCLANHFRPNFSPHNITIVTNQCVANFARKLIFRLSRFFSNFPGPTAG